MPNQKQSMNEQSSRNKINDNSTILDKMADENSVMEFEFEEGTVADTQPIKANPSITLSESELNTRLQRAYDKGRVEMLLAVKKDITRYFDDVLTSYIPQCN